MKAFIVLNGKGEDVTGLFRSREAAKKAVAKHNSRVDEDGGGDYDDYWHVSETEVSGEEVDEMGGFYEDHDIAG